ncbi:hypothetical protein MNBD_NITROSPINAE01-58 [hydrothermal vent metagenome]|uniref:ABC transporter domain-containing protein n=1 Tax=hydrothermal vent metagenome TaxID=652676 RepID=A0A3B1C1Q1_9ZZZZ
MIIEFKNIFFSHPPSEHGDGSGKEVFSAFSLSVQRGAKLIVKGRSGGGKTTLLRLMAWLVEPDRGEILFNGKPYASYNPPFLRRKISLVAQTPVMLEGSVRHNLSLGLETAPPDKILHEWLEKFALETPVLNQSARSLSVGQQQRVAVIRNLLLKPSVILLDEPTSGLDPESAEIFREAMMKISETSGLTVVWNSHNVEKVKSIATDIVTIGEPA